MTDQLAIAGGAPIRPEGYPDWPIHDARDEAQLLAVLRSGRWGGYPEPGPYNAQFCEQFAAFQGSKYGILMVNGTVTMEVALKALGIGWGDEVIVPGLTFAATAYAPMAAGAVPVVVDVDQRSWGIDAEAVEAAITPRTRAIIPVHAGQIVCDMDALTAIAKRHGLAIIEDCAHSPGKMWRGRGIGSFGEFGSF
ncbi:MAG: DegT/DnrJ/EryC1/StrS family aminotransferase, partial [Roseiflexaceae bacterium]